MRNTSSKIVGQLSLLLGIIAVVVLWIGHAWADKATIKIFTKETNGTINPNVYGINFIGYDPTTYETWTKEYYGFSDYGAGIWDPHQKKPVKNVIELAKNAGVRMARFPGGCGSHHYDWKKAIGDKREHFLFGIDEFLTVCEELNAQAVITLSFLTGTEQDAADLVEYLNAPDDGSNPRGGIDWAKERAKNGRMQPYNVKFFEIGNEEWHGDHLNSTYLSPVDYAQRYLRYFSAIKETDPHAQVGAILYIPEWNNEVLSRIKDKIDFGIVHPYMSADIDNSLVEKMPPGDIFQMTLANIPLTHEPYLQNILRAMKKYSNKDVPLAVTEYNVGFNQEKPVPFRFCLGAALVNAEFLRVLMDPRNNVLMANHWEFSNSHWGMVYATEDYQKHDYSLPLKYIRRPNYFVYELYAKHFGQVLLKSEVNGPTYTISSLNIPENKQNIIQKIKQTLRNNIRPGFDTHAAVPYISVNASKDEQTNTIYVIVVNKHMQKPIQCMLTLDSFDAQPQALIWTLQGENAATLNEDGSENAALTQNQVCMTGNECSIEFAPCTVTALEFKRQAKIP